MTSSAIHNNPYTPLSPKKHTKEQLLQIVVQTLTNHLKVTKHPNLDKFKLGINKNLIHSYYSLKVIVEIAGEEKHLKKSRNRGIAVLKIPKEQEHVTLQMYPNFDDIWVCTIHPELNKQEIEERINGWIESYQPSLAFRV